LRVLGQDSMRRREFIKLIGATASMPLAARAQGSMPVIGFLGSQTPSSYTPLVAAFREGLREAGFVEGQNVAIEYRWAEEQSDRLPGLAAELVQRRVAVIAAIGGAASGLAGKAATASIPIVFTSGIDPVEAGLVSSLNRPGGNVTGVSWFTSELAAKRVALLHELVPVATDVAFLVDPRTRESASQSRLAQEAASQLGHRLFVLNASTPGEIDAAFVALQAQGARALVVASAPFFLSHRQQVTALAARHAIPCIHSERYSVVDGGLMSYGNNLSDAYRRAGMYVGRILKGDRPSDLPIYRSTLFELVINLKTAKTLGLELSPSLLARADEVIE
jgi:putative tryptophan/tyrosine transport system substrate-binding protein